MAGGKAEKANAPRPALQPASMPAAQKASPLTQAMAATPLGRVAEAIRTSPLMQARSAAAYGFRAQDDSALAVPRDPYRRDVAQRRHAPPQAFDPALIQRPATPAHLPKSAAATLAAMRMMPDAGPGPSAPPTQLQVRRKPVLQMTGVAINDDAGLEKEADAMGALARSGRFAFSRSASQPQQELCDHCATRLNERAPVQRMRILWTDQKIRKATPDDDPGKVRETLDLDADERAVLKDNLKSLGADDLSREIEAEWAQAGLASSSAATAGPAAAAASSSSTSAKLDAVLANAAHIAAKIINLPPLKVNANQLAEAQRQVKLQLDGLNALNAADWLCNLLINRMKTADARITEAYGTEGGQLLGGQIEKLLTQNHDVSKLLMTAIENRMTALLPYVKGDVLTTVNAIAKAAADARKVEKVYLEFLRLNGLHLMNVLTKAGLAGGIGRQHGAGDEKEFRKAHSAGIDRLKAAEPDTFGQNACLHNPDQCAGGPMEILWSVAQQKTLADARQRAWDAMSAYNQEISQNFGKSTPAKDAKKLAADQAEWDYQQELKKHVGNSAVNSLLGSTWMQILPEGKGVINRLDAILQAVLKIPFDKLAETPLKVVMEVTATVPLAATSKVSAAAGGGKDAKANAQKKRKGSSAAANAKAKSAKTKSSKAKSSKDAAKRTRGPNKKLTATQKHARDNERLKKAKLDLAGPKQKSVKSFLYDKAMAASNNAAAAAASAATSFPASTASPAASTHIDLTNDDDDDNTSMAGSSVASRDEDDDGNSDAEGDDDSRDYDNNDDDNNNNNTGADYGGDD